MPDRNAGYRRWVRTSAVLGIAVGAGCAGTVFSPSNDTALGRLSPAPARAMASPAAAFYVGESIGTAQKPYAVAEYARDAKGNAVPLRALLLSGAMFGIDAAGYIYTSNITRFGGDSCIGATECVIRVYDASGRRTRSFRVPLSTTDPPAAVAVDNLGRVYVSGALGDGIDIYAANASGTPRPARTLAFDAIGPPVGGGFPSAGPTPLLVDANYNIYLSGGKLSRPKIAEFAPGGSGTVSPSRTISSKGLYDAPQAVDRQGNLWTVNAKGSGNQSLALVYGPQQQGYVQPLRQVQLIGGTRHLTLTRGGDIVYVLYDNDGCRIVLMQPGAKVANRTISQTGPCKTFVAVTF
jgi:hypothetical protein